MDFKIFSHRNALLSFLMSLGIGFVLARVCIWIDTPLPWMLGPLFGTAALRMAGIPLTCPVRAREAGQWAIGTALGLYFTPSVIIVLASYGFYIAAGVLFALTLGALSGWLLHKLSGIDRTTAFFAMAIGGASEMANQGERHGAKVDRVAAAHSLRIMLVIAIVPILFKFAHIHGADLYVPAARVVDYPRLLLLIALTSAGALAFKAVKSPNSWVLGPLAVTIALTASGITLSALPEWMINLGQLFIAISLGSYFTPEFLHTAPRYLASVALCTLTAMAVAACFALGLSAASGMPAATAILATSPGGIAEMSLTAKTLRLGVPIVTAFHVTRITALVLAIGPLFRFARRVKYWKCKESA